MIKIAFIGRQRSGKTTGAEALKLHFLKQGWEGTNVYMTSFGKRMKQDFELFIGEKFDKKEHRKMIQLFGQLHRSYNNDIWVNYVAGEMLSAQRQGFSHFIIDDVRQANEVQFCKDNGFVLVYVDVPLLHLHRRCIGLEEDFTPAHSTECVEQFYGEASLIISNSNDILVEDFKDTLIECVDSLIEQQKEDECHEQD